jgi:hypothetical protein
LPVAIKPNNQGEQTMTNDTTTKIAQLNHLCRTAMGLAGKVYQTRGITALSPDDQSAIREKVETFDAFTPDAISHCDEGCTANLLNVYLAPIRYGAAPAARRTSPRRLRLRAHDHARRHTHSRTLTG